MKPTTRARLAAGPVRVTKLLLFGVACLFFVLGATAQSNTAELRLLVADPAGLGLGGMVQITSEANSVAKTLATDVTGALTVARLPFGLYRIRVRRPGFLAQTRTVALDSALPITLRVTLPIEGSSSTVLVPAAREMARETLIDPNQSGVVTHVGRSTLDEGNGALPGRSIIDRINEQPGWLFEGSAVLHPRGSEYQVQYVVDGIPLTDNRSPGMGVELEADAVESLSLYTAGIPAEYGRKMGGVVELNTIRNSREGLHGVTALSGGSFATAVGYTMAQYAWGERNTASVSAEGAETAWYGNPPVLENFTNQGTTGDFSGQYERELTPSDRLTFTTRHELARSLVPNERVQEQAGQRQDRDALETIGSAGYQHIFSPNLIANLHVMVRDDTAALSSNASSTPIIAGQDRGYRESYVKATAASHHGRQEWKAGVEADFADLHEGFEYTIADPTQFDPGTPATFFFFERGSDREQAAFVEDTLHVGGWNIAAGLRWDRYKLLVEQSALSPRLSVARSLPRLKMLAHVSYDRVFQTPALENILLSSSSAVSALNANFLRLPVKPSHGNYYEAGITQGWGQLRFDANSYLRTVNNYADDDQLLDTSVGFPIAFRKARIYGVEGKLAMAPWHGASGFASYSYMVGSAYLPVTGGLFLGDDATQALSQTSGRFWDSQDQRHTVRGHLRYQVLPRVWVASGAEYGSGLPTEFDGDYADAVAQYGAALVGRVNFARDRVRPSLAVNASLGADLLHRDQGTLAVQVGGENLNNRVNLIDFAGLFSGNAVAPPASWSARLRWSF